MTRPTAQPWALAIETSNPPAGPASVAAAESIGSQDIDSEPLRKVARHNDDLMPAIDRLASRTARKPSGLAAVCVSSGPGGYTALRVAISTAVMLAEASRAKLRLVPTPLVAAAALAARDPNANGALVCLASKRGVAHTTRITRAGVSWSAEDLGLLDASAVAAAAQAHHAPLVLADEHLPAETRDAVLSAGGRVEHPALSAEACLIAARWVTPTYPAHARPHYPRQPEAVRLWRAGEENR